MKLDMLKKWLNIISNCKAISAENSLLSMEISCDAPWIFDESGTR